MRENIIKHLSYRFFLNLDNKNAAKTDKLSNGAFYMGLFWALVLIFIGAFALYDTVYRPASVFDKLGKTEYSTFLPIWLFDAILMLLGVGIAVSLAISRSYYKKFFFDGKKFIIITKKLGEIKEKFAEPLKNYEGIRMRTEFLQYGLFRRNRYIIELAHKNPQKVVLLYANLSNDGFKAKAKYFAQKLDKPIIFFSDNGETKVNVKDMDKSLRQKVNEGIILDDYDSYEKLPSSVAFVRKRDKIVLKVRKIYGDAYNWLAAALVAFFVIIFVSNWQTLTKIIDNDILAWFIAALLLAIIFSLFILFRKDKIAIKKAKIVHVEKFFGFSRKCSQIMKDDIEDIDVGYNPSSGRYFVTVYAKNNNIVFAKKLPIEDLRWIKRFLIHEIVK